MKASGSYKPLVQGVSQQVPQDRREGQVTEMVNMIPDPVKGLTRRQGSRFQSEINTGIADGLYAACVADTANWRMVEYVNGGKDYVLLFRTTAKEAGSTLPPVLAYNRTDRVWLTYQRNTIDLDLDSLEAGGVSAAVSIGKFTFAAANATTAAATTTDLYGANSNQLASVVWVRGGAYNRKFTVTATKADGTQVEFDYTTPSASYPGTLDTSGVAIYVAAVPTAGVAGQVEAVYLGAPGTSGFIEYRLNWENWGEVNLSVANAGVAMTNTSPSNPTLSTEYRWDGAGNPLVFVPALQGEKRIQVTYDHTMTTTNPVYSKQVTDITNQYNNAVNAWIISSALAITPQAIAVSLQAAAVAAGLTTATVTDSTIIFDNIVSLTVDDGGDLSLIRAVANEITSVDQVSLIHLIGKVVKVRPVGSADAFYLKAVPQDKTITSGYAKVTWVEGQAIKYAITSGLFYFTVVGSHVYAASTAAGINTLAGTTDAPDYVASTVGDADTSPLPFFVGHPITYLGVFQDRLMVGSGATMRCSRTSDYLNFFRTSVLTIPADDAFEMLSQSALDDTLRYSVLYALDLVVFGDKRQYVISGHSVLTPTNANMAVMSQHADAASLQPASVGGVLYYGKLGETESSVYQIEPTTNPESPSAFLVSSQLNDYIEGNCVAISYNAKPSVLFLQTDALRNSLVTFQYLDVQGGGRKQDAWGRWDFDPAMGSVIGMSPTPGGLLVYFIKPAAGTLWLVAQLFVLTTTLSHYPYLDDLRTFESVAAGAGSVRATAPTGYFVAFDDSSDFRYQGGPLAYAADTFTQYPLATGPWVGTNMPAYVIPTNPFIRDRNGVAITTGRLTITKLQVTCAQSAGFSWTITADTGDTNYTFNGRVLGDPNNIVGRVPVTGTQTSVPIGLETSEYSLKLTANDWSPLTFTDLQWIGQSFNNVQRI